MQHVPLSQWCWKCMHTFSTSSNLHCHQNQKLLLVAHLITSLQGKFKMRQLDNLVFIHERSVLSVIAFVRERQFLTRLVPFLYTPQSTCSLVLYVLVLKITSSSAHDYTSKQKPHVKGAQHPQALNWRIDNAGGLGYSIKSRQVGMLIRLKSMCNSLLHIII